MANVPAPEPSKRKSIAQHKKLAQLLANDTPVGEALVSAGWSPTQALKGWDAVPDAVFVTLPKKAKKLVALGKADKDTRRNLVRGRLISNTISGKDGGAMSAKILGSDTELNMWQPEMNQGLVILTPPASLTREKMDAMLKDGRAEQGNVE
jgi:hypothetical protein